MKINGSTVSLESHWTIPTEGIFDQEKVSGPYRLETGVLLRQFPLRLFETRMKGAVASGELDAIVQDLI